MAVTLVCTSALVWTCLNEPEKRPTTGQRAGVSAGGVLARPGGGEGARRHDAHPRRQRDGQRGPVLATRARAPGQRRAWMARAACAAVSGAGLSRLRRLVDRPPDEVQERGDRDLEPDHQVDE